MKSFTTKTLGMLVLAVLLTSERVSAWNHQEYQTSGSGGANPSTEFCRRCSDHYCDASGVDHCSSTGQFLSWTCNCRNRGIGSESTMRSACQTDCSGRSPKRATCSGRSCDCECNGVPTIFEVKKVMTLTGLSFLSLFVAGKYFL